MEAIVFVPLREASAAFEADIGASLIGLSTKLGAVGGFCANLGQSVSVPSQLRRHSWAVTVEFGRLDNAR